MSKKISALIASTRGKKTASESIVNYLHQKITEKKESKDLEPSFAFQLKKFRVHEIFNKKQKLTEFLKETKESDTIIISTPVYVHSLPYPLTFILEKMLEESRECWQGKELTAIIHCGYPESIQRKASIQICKDFADESGMKWLGALDFGGSPIIDGRQLEEVGYFTKWIRRSLDCLSENLIRGEEISEEAYKLAKKNRLPIPGWVMKIMMNMMVKKNIKKQGLDINVKPYLAQKGK